MPTGQYSVGRDITLVLVTSGGPLHIRGITSFQSKQDTTENKIIKLDGITDHVRFFVGWSGRFMIERKDETLDAYFSQLEASYYAGVNEQYASITETISELDGSISQFRYLKVLLKFDDAGDWRGDTTVKQNMSFVASRRIQIA